MNLKNNIENGNTRSVYCDGGDQISGHPGVYLEIGAKNYTDCPYCGKMFEYNIEKDE